LVNKPPFEYASTTRLIPSAATLIQPWHLTTAGGTLDNDYATNSAWVAQPLAGLKQLVIPNTASESRLPHTVPVRPCVPAPPEYLYVDLRLLQPAIPISSQQLAKLAPALEVLAIGDESPATRYPSGNVFNVSLGPLWGGMRIRAAKQCLTCEPSTTLLDTYSMFTDSRPHPLSANYIAFPEGIQTLCKLRQLKLLRLHPLTEHCKVG
jgi:hypothetical protein